MNCLHCGKVITGRKSKKFCGDAHKVAYWRLQQQPDQDTIPALAKELEDARATIAELEQEVTRLKRKLDIERRLLEDHQQRSFRAWLKKQPRAYIGELGQRIQSDEFVPALGSRAVYTARLRGLNYSSDEISEFTNLWKLMLLS